MTKLTFYYIFQSICNASDRVEVNASDRVEVNASGRVEVNASDRVEVNAIGTNISFQPQACRHMLKAWMVLRMHTTLVKALPYRLRLMGQTDPTAHSRSEGGVILGHQRQPDSFSSYSSSDPETCDTLFKVHIVFQFTSSVYVIDILCSVIDI